VAASCHSLDELHHAMAIGVDFAVVSPVKATASHPDAVAIGWHGFQLLTEHAGIPVFALGGMSELDLEAAWKYGGQGIAAIRALWPKMA
jgi:8-oxo-dGTP diphosphatase